MQTFALDATTHVLSGDLCLTRDAGDDESVVAGACDGSSPLTSWTLTPCTVAGCEPSSNQSVVTSLLGDARVLGIPGAVGPWADVWTLDNPTGSFHNELWAYNATDGTVRSLNTGGPPDIFQQCLTLFYPPPPPPPCTLTPRVRCHVGVWDSPPSRVPSTGVVDGPLLGNGDLGAVFASSSASPFSIFFGKGDMWATNTEVDKAEPSLHSDTFYTAIGGADLSFGPASSSSSSAWTLAGFSATQDLATSSVNSTVNLTSSSASFTASLTSSIVARDENTLLSTLRISSSPSVPPGTPVNFSFTLQTRTAYSLPLSSGAAAPSSSSPSLSSASPPLIWATKQGVRSVDNPMLLMPCDGNTFVIWPSVTTFSLDQGTNRVRVSNGTSSSPPSALCPSQPDPASSKLSIGPCDPPSSSSAAVTDWRLVPAASPSAPQGSFQLQAAANASACAYTVPPAYHNSGGLVAVGPCSAQQDFFWTVSSPSDGSVQLQANTSQCLTAVPPNVNITLAVVLAVVSAADGTPAPLAAPPTASNSSDGTWSASSAVYTLMPDTDYLVVVAGATTRDTDWAEDPLGAALAQARQYVGEQGPAAVAARYAAHVGWWEAFWGASSIHLDDTSRQVLESAWYGFQHNLASTVAPGEVFPGLWGVWAVEDGNGWVSSLPLPPPRYHSPSPLTFLAPPSLLPFPTPFPSPPPPLLHTQNGDMTLDYNVQANVYGAHSSNQLWQIRPYLDQVASDWHVETSRRRAAANWLAKGSAGGPGQTAQSMACGYMDQAYENPHICSNTTKGGFSGIELTTHIGPFPGLFYFADLSLRVVAAMSAKPFVDYVEYSGDMDYLNSTAYPFVASVCDFFVSYATPNATTGRSDILNSCAQEICGGGPEIEYNVHHDIAYLATSLRAAIKWSAALGGRDPEKVAAWTHLLSTLPDLPTGTYANQTVWTESEGTESFFPSNGAAYSIVYTAALHPAESITLSSDPALLDVGWSTVEALGKVNAYRPLNGLAMMWSPASRVAGQARAAEVLDAWEAAFAARAYPNFYPDLGGGGIEQFGAADAINAALMQGGPAIAGEGFIRLFPVWPASENASFTGLRAAGAFLVSAEWSAAGAGGGGGGGVVSPFTIAADGTPPADYARNCSFLSPWGTSQTPVVTVVGTGQPVPVSPSSSSSVPGVWTFVAQPGTAYEVAEA